MNDSVVAPRAQGDLCVRRLSGATGAEVAGCELRTMTPAGAEQLRKLLLEYGMLVIRDAHLSAPELEAFGRWWGKPWNTPNFPPLKNSEYLYAVQNLGKERVITENWHYDSTYAQCPPAISILSAHVLPSAGGDTIWASQYAAFDALSPAMQRLCEPLRALHVDVGLYEHAGMAARPTDPVSHPVVRVHPETQRKALFLSIGVQRFDGVTAAESKGLFDYLYQHASRPDFCYRHSWRLGDVVIWDNRCTMHYAVHDYGEEKRKLYRVTVDDGMPVG